MLRAVGWCKKGEKNRKQKQLNKLFAVQWEKVSSNETIPFLWVRGYYEKPPLVESKKFADPYD
jgi:hypothetical protein